MATAATASASVSSTTSNSTLSDNERRWLVIGICLNKFLTPALRKVLKVEIPAWYQTLIKPPIEIDKQTFKNHQVYLTPSKIFKLNYDSINNNRVHKFPKSYHYAVKDPLSLAKLFMKPSMASFTSFDDTMDTSAVLSVMSEAQPFIGSGAANLAKKVRRDVRNEWAHCNFSHWTESNYETAMQDMESLVTISGLPSHEAKLVVDDLRKNGKELFLGNPLDQELLTMLQMEVAQLENTFKELNAEVHETETVLERLGAINSSLKDEIDKLKERQATTDVNMQELQSNLQELRAGQRDIRADQSDLRRSVEELCGNVTKNENEDLHVFSAPDPFSWFTGRTRQIEEIETILKNGDQSSPRKAAICGLGGSGKTSLVVEYANRMKNHYQGGVFLFSGEDETKLENSVTDLALSFELAISNSFDVTFRQTLARISRIKKPWLLIIDDMDELQVSPNLRKLLSGSWQKKCNYGHIIVTTRRNPSTLVNEVQAFRERSCLELQCFDADDSKEFLFTRTGILRNEETKAAAHKLFEELGGLPLALAQAAAYIKSLGCSFSSYLESYKAKRLALLNQQPSNPVSEYSSLERLAIRTTWGLNIDYIKKNSEGKNALRFLNACAFFNPDQIQEELINVGDPPIKDDQFRNFLGTSLGRYQILKLLTDFSLFKQSSYGCLQVHRLVLDVIKESLTPSEQEESFVDAVRFLQHSLSKCCSPDVLLSSVAGSEINLVDHTNPSLFYMWRTLCMHAEEIEKNLKSFLCNNTETTVFLPETAQIIYQHALYLSVFYKHEEAVQAMNFALKILDWIPYAERELPYTDYISSFHHVVPLSESFRRYVQYCSKAPAPALPLGNAEQRADSSIEAEALEFEKLREEGNRLFCDGRYQDAVDVYSTAIERKDESKCFDPRFFSNRASAYLRLERYEDALKDAEAYISQSPKCWKGYARKALALHGAGDKLGAKLAACLTFILNSEVLTEYKRFEKFSHLKQCITRSSNLVDAVGKKIICLHPGTYDISQYVRFQDCIVIGFDESSSDMAKVTVNFVGQSSAGVVGRCAFANLEFVFEQGRCCCWENSVSVFQNCSFTSHSKDYPSLTTVGETTVENCEFKNCNAAGLRCARGTLRVNKKSTFYGNKKAGLQVRESGTLLAKNVNIHHNHQGLEVGPKAKRCTLTNSQVNNSEREGIYCVHSHCDESVNIRFENNAIFHNDTFGVFVFDSAADIIGNNVYENSWWGVWIQSNSYCRFSKNKVNRNGVGGVRIGVRGPDCQPCVVDSNTVNNNGGPGIFEHYNPVDKPFLFRQLPLPSLPTDQLLPQDLEDKLVHAHCQENTTLGNKELDKKPSCIYSTQNGLGFCSYCRKETKLQKCDKCYTAGYCRPSCREEHWERFHKEACPTLLERNSVVLCDPISPPGVRHRSRPQQVGAQNREQFIVKVQIDEPELGIQISDRNLHVDESFNSDRIRNLVIDLGVPHLEVMKIKKKLFMWAAFTENEMIRLFTNDFPPFQEW